MMKKFDLLNLEDGMIVETKDGTYYVYIGGVLYNFSDEDRMYDYIVLNRDGKCTKEFKDNRKDVKNVYIMNTCPKANRMSEAMKEASGIGSKYTLDMVYRSEDPRVTAARERMEKAKRDYEAAQNDLARLSYDD